MKRACCSGYTLRRRTTPQPARGIVCAPAGRFAQPALARLRRGAIRSRPGLCRRVSMAESTPEDGLSSPASMLSFPEGFRWGVATASHQYEGDNTNNNWYAWERAGRIVSGDSCGLAADWWAHAERDFDFAAQLDLNALRLS